MNFVSVRWHTTCIRNEIDHIHYCQFSVLFLHAPGGGCRSLNLTGGKEIQNAAIAHKEGFLKLNDVMCLRSVTGMIFEKITLNPSKCRRLGSRCWNSQYVSEFRAIINS